MKRIWKKAKPGFISIKTTYTLTMLLLIVIFTTVISQLWGSFYKTQLWNSTANYAKQIMESSSNNFDKMLSDINYSMSALAFNDEFNRILQDPGNSTEAQMIASRRTMESLLRSVMSSNSSIKDISLSTVNGTYFSMGSYYQKTPAVISGYYKLAKGKNTTVFVTDEQEHTATPDVMNLTMIRILNENQNSEAIMMVTVNCSTLLKPYRVTRDFDYGFLIYNHSTQQQVFQENLNQIGFAQKSFDFQKFFKDSGNQTYNMTSQNNENYMLMKYLSTLTNWETVVVIPQKSLLKNYKDATNINMQIILLCIVAAFSATILIANALTKNIQKLSHAVEKIGGDNLKIDIKISANDEVGLLYQKFTEMVERIQQQMIAIRYQEEVKRKLEIKALQTQITPHFLYNSLSTIKFMASIQNSRNIMEASDALSNMLHTSMSKEEYITLAQEENYLESYVCLKEYQIGHPIHFFCRVEDGVKNYKILKLLIQPIVENSIIHSGILEKSDGYISVGVFCKEDALKVVVKDNGIGMSAEKLTDILGNLESSRSIGLYNVMERVRLNYGGKYQVVVSSEAGMYTMTELTLPIIL